MTRILPLVLMLVLAGSAFAQKKTDKTDKGTLNTDKQKISYIIGYEVLKNYKQNGLDLEPEAALQGMQDAATNTTSRIGDSEKQTLIQKVNQEMSERMNQKRKADGDVNTKEGEAYLAENAKKPGVMITASGLQYRVIKDGTGAQPKAEDVVRVHYEGRLINGKIFDSSYKRNEPAEFPVKGVIPGWVEALQLMKVGSEWELTIPGKLAYGENGAGEDIGPNAVLIFKVELLEIKDKK